MMANIDKGNKIIGVVPVVNPLRIDVVYELSGLKGGCISRLITHEYIDIRWCRFGTNCSATDLKILFYIEHENY